MANLTSNEDLIVRTLLKGILRQIQKEGKRKARWSVAVTFRALVGLRELRYLFGGVRFVTLPLYVALHNYITRWRIYLLHIVSAIYSLVYHLPCTSSRLSLSEPTL